MSEIDEMIAEFGWAVQHVAGGEWPGEPPLTFTIGLTPLGHPEIVTLGLPGDSAMLYLHLVVHRVRNGARFKAGQVTRALLDGGAPLAFIDVVDVEQLQLLRRRYGRIECLQLVWPDSGGFLPWDEGWANAVEDQPLLGSLPAKWNEPAG